MMIMIMKRNRGMNMVEKEASLELMAALMAVREFPILSLALLLERKRIRLVICRLQGR